MSNNLKFNKKTPEQAGITECLFIYPGNPEAPFPAASLLMA
jgi:hypothetical protein